MELKPSGVYVMLASNGLVKIGKANNAEIRREIGIFESEAELWESRDVEEMPTPDFYSRIDELRQELGYIQDLQRVFEDEQ
jgi:hypothetical protein